MTITPHRRRAAIYVRISKDKRDQAGIARQETEARELAAKKGWDVVAVYADNDFEASSGKPRPAYLRMLQAMRDDEIDAVVGYHSDRIYRLPSELEELVKLAEAHDVQFAAVLVGNIDLSTASGRMIARMLGAASAYEVELKGERQASQLRQRREAGLPSGGGTKPYGWKPGGMEICEPEAAVIREAVKAVLAGETVGSICDELADRGILTPAGKRWVPTVLKRSLMNPRLAGLMTYKGDVVGEGKWDPIIDVPTHHRLVEVLTYRGPARRPNGRLAILNGLIWCTCGYPLVTYRVARPEVPGGVRTYACRTKYLIGREGYKKSCGKISIKAEALEDDIAERLIAHLTSPGSAERLAQARGAGGDDRAIAAARELGEIEERLRSLGVDYADGLLGRTEFLAARDRLTEKVDALRRVSATPKSDAPIGDVEAMVTWWNGAAVAKKSTLLHEYVDRIVIGRHNGRRSHYDPTRVAITWR